MSEQRNYTPIIVVGLLAVTAITIVYFVTRKPRATVARARQISRPTAPQPQQNMPVVMLSKVASYAGAAAEAPTFTEEGLPRTFYLNKEKWDIEWNAEGFPTHIEAERSARRS
jgi:hypothetical protein